MLAAGSLPADAASRIKDLANIEGVRQNQLIGYGATWPRDGDRQSAGFGTQGTAIDVTVSALGDANPDLTTATRIANDFIGAQPPSRSTRRRCRSRCPRPTRATWCSCSRKSSSCRSSPTWAPKS